MSVFTIAGLLENVLWGHIIAFSPLFIRSLGIQGSSVPLWTGLLTAIPNAIGILLLPLWGAWADRYPRKQMILRSFAAYALGGLLVALAGDRYAFFCGRLLLAMAMGNGGLIVLTLSDHIPARHRHLGLAIMNSTSLSGAFLGPLVGGPVMDGFGFRTLLLIDAGLIFCVLLLLTISYRDHEPPKEHGPVLRMAKETVRIVLRSRPVRQLFPPLILLYSGWMLATIYLPVFLGIHHPAPNMATRIGYMIGAGGLGTALLAPLMGAAADRYSVRKVLAVAIPAEFGLWMLQGLTRSLLTFGAVWVLVNGVAGGIFSCTITILSSYVVGNDRGRIMTFAYLPLNASYVVASAIGSYQGPRLDRLFVTAGAVSLVGGLLLMAVQRSGHTPR